MTLASDRPFLISPPFGSYFRSARAYSVLGSFTRFPRPGRTMRVLRTVRPVPGGWVNKIGLRNPGAVAAAEVLADARSGTVTSFALIDGDSAEWDWLVEFVRLSVGSWPRVVEVNVSCPNTDHPVPALPSESQARALIDTPNLTVIWKLQPVEKVAIEATSFLMGVGARYLHLSNTLPSPVGGISGAALREANLGIVERRARYIAQRCNIPVNGYRGPEIIAGGGIYAPEHVLQYRDAGATHFSLATAFMNPWRGYRIIRKGIT